MHFQRGPQGVVLGQAPPCGVVGHGPHRQAEQLPAAHGAEVFNLQHLAVAEEGIGGVGLGVGFVGWPLAVLGPGPGDGCQRRRLGGKFQFELVAGAQFCHLQRAALGQAHQGA